MSEEIKSMDPAGLVEYPAWPDAPPPAPVEIPVYKVTVNDSVNWLDLLKLFVKESVITNILSMKGVAMTDYKTSIAAAVAALAQIAGLLGLGIPAEIITIVTAIAVAAFGYFAKDKTAA